MSRNDRSKTARVAGASAGAARRFVADESGSASVFAPFAVPMMAMTGDLAVFPDVRNDTDGAENPARPDAGSTVARAQGNVLRTIGVALPERAAGVKRGCALSSAHALRVEGQEVTALPAIPDTFSALRLIQ